MCSHSLALPVGVLGAGNVGSSLVQALLANGHEVTVWNRNPGRLERLQTAGAAVAGDAAAAVTKGRLVFVALSDIRASSGVLESISDADLNGRLVVQLSGGPAEQSEALGLKVRARGARYLDGLLYSYPEALLDGTAMLFFSGAQKDYDLLAETVLDAAAWDVTYLGEQLGRAKQISNLFEAASTNAIGGYLLGAALADAQGIPVRKYAELLVPRLLPTLQRLIEECTAAIETGNYQSEMSIDRWRDAVGRQIQDAERLGVDPSSLQVVDEQMERGIVSGLGSSGISALYTVMRKPPGRRNQRLIHSEPLI